MLTTLIRQFLHVTFTCLWGVSVTATDCQCWCLEGYATLISYGLRCKRGHLRRIAGNGRPVGHDFFYCNY